LWPGDAISVQSLRDGTRRAAGRELGKDTADDRSFGIIDGAAAVDRLPASVVLADHVVAEADAAAGPAVAHPAFQPSTDLLGQILQVKRVHRALKPDMQFADLALGDGEEADRMEKPLASI
jgi:hypothetical protein